MKPKFQFKKRGWILYENPKMKRSRSDYHPLLAKGLEEAEKDLRKRISEEFKNSEQFRPLLEEEGSRILTRLVRSKKELEKVKQDPKFQSSVRKQAKAIVNDEYRRRAVAKVKPTKPVEKLTPLAKALPPPVFKVHTHSK